MRQSILIAAALIAGTPAMAQDMIKGVYTRSPEQCAAAKADFQAYIETGDIVLTPRGLEGIEFNCDFVDWKMATRSPGAIVTALCEEPGYAYPQLFAVMPRGEGELEFTLATSPADGEATNAGIYYLCEGVPLP